MYFGLWIFDASFEQVERTFHSDLVFNKNETYCSNNMTETLRFFVEKGLQHTNRTQSFQPFAKRRKTKQNNVHSIHPAFKYGQMWEKLKKHSKMSVKFNPPSETITITIANFLCFPSNMWMKLFSTRFSSLPVYILRNTLAIRLKSHRTALTNKKAEAKSKTNERGNQGSTREKVGCAEWKCLRKAAKGGEMGAHYEPTCVGRPCDTATKHMCSNAVRSLTECVIVSEWVCVSLVAIRMVVVSVVTWLIFQPTHKRMNEGRESCQYNNAMSIKYNFFVNIQSSNNHIHFTACIQLTPFNLFEHIEHKRPFILFTRAIQREDVETCVNV